MIGPNASGDWIPQLKMGNIRVISANFQKKLRVLRERFEGSSLSENCSLLGTDNVRGKISEHNYFRAKWRLLFIYFAPNEGYIKIVYLGSSCSSRKVSPEWLPTVWENNRTNNRNNAPSPKTITAAKNEENYKLTRDATLLNFLSRCDSMCKFLQSQICFGPYQGI